MVTISGTFILMGAYDVMLERISLGALIIALGMLVDNAIVVIDGMQVRIEGGMDKVKAAKEVVPELHAAPGGHGGGHHGLRRHRTSQDSTGEYTARCSP